MCSMVKKLQITETHVDVKTTNGYLLYLFHIGFTKEKKSNSLKDILQLTPTDPPNPEKVDGNHVPKGTDK